MTGRRPKKRKRDPGQEHLSKLNRQSRRAAANLDRKGGSQTLRSVMFQLLGI